MTQCSHDRAGKPRHPTLVPALVALLLGLAPMADAKSPEERLIDDLEDQLDDMGFEVERVERTLLGRVRIVAEGRGLWREIIINPRTGEVLRDYARPLDAGDRPAAPILRRNWDDDDHGRQRDRHD